MFSDRFSRSASQERMNAVLLFVSLLFIIIGIFLQTIPGWPCFFGLLTSIWGLLGLVQGIVQVVRVRRSR